ncbi:MAG: TrkH family potassium uptake protein, partial [Alphaproteobacteria bacterium]|nr:TrkH family potassium uptake protein [Alphaproteobacteria bacterium]
IAPFAIGGLRISDNPLLQHDVGDSAVARLLRPLRIIFPIYAGGTIIGVVALLLSGMPLLDAFCLGLSAISTTGFVVSNLPMAEIYSLPAQSILAMLSFVGAMSMPLLVLTILGRSHIAQLFTLRNDELRLFVIFIVLYAIISAIFSPHHIYREFLQAISFASTAGFAFTDINSAPIFWTLILPVIGGCALSTAGGIKVMRVVILAKGIGADLRRLIYPSLVSTIRLDNKRLEPQDINSMWAFLSLFFLIYMGGLLIMGALGLSFAQAWVMVAATLSNSGAILNAHNVLDIPTMSDGLKIASGLLMIIGRLEFPVALVLFTSAFRQFIR